RSAHTLVSRHAAVEQEEDTMEPERASGRGGAIVLLLLIAALAFGARPSPAPGTLLAITHEPFYGWTDAYRMSNGHMAVSVVPAAGGRVLEFSLDGQQALLVNPALQVEVSTNDRTLPYIEMEVLGPLVRLE